MRLSFLTPHIPGQVEHSMSFILALEKQLSMYYYYYYFIPLSHLILQSMLAKERREEVKWEQYKKGRRKEGRRKGGHKKESLLCSLIGELSWRHAVTILSQCRAQLWPWPGSAALSSLDFFPRDR